MLFNLERVANVADEFEKQLVQSAPLAEVDVSSFISLSEVKERIRLSSCIVSPANIQGSLRK